MAFVRATSPAPAPAASPGALLDSLDSADAAVRRQAARGLSGSAEAAPRLAARLETEPDSSVREALFGSLARIGGSAAADLLAPLLRSADAALRNEALEALRLLDEADAAAAVDRLLADPSPDVRLLAIEVTRAWSSEAAVPRLRHLIEADPHVNVCAAAVDVATEVGTVALRAPLAALRARFAQEPFLTFSVDIALARLEHGGAADRRPA